MSITILYVKYVGKSKKIHKLNHSFFIWPIKRVRLVMYLLFMFCFVILIIFPNTFVIFFKYEVFFYPNKNVQKLSKTSTWHLQSQSVSKDKKDKESPKRHCKTTPLGNTMLCWKYRKSLFYIYRENISILV